MHLFISYAHADFKKVEQLAEIFEAAGHEVWYDRALAGGDNWWQSILTNIESADVFIFALTPQSTASEACRAEYQYALDLNRPILPVMLADAELPIGRLQETQFVTAKGLNRQDTALQLTRALFHLRDRLAAGDFPKPTPLPPRPRFPFPDDPLYEARAVVQNLRSANTDDLMQLILRLKQVARENSHTIAEARHLVELISQSPHVSQHVAMEANDALQTINKRARPVARVHGDHTKISNARTWGLRAIGLVIALIAVVGLITLLNQGDSDNKSHTSTPTEAAAARNPTDESTEAFVLEGSTPSPTATLHATAAPSGDLIIWYPDTAENQAVMQAWVSLYATYRPEVTVKAIAIPSGKAGDLYEAARGFAQGPDIIWDFGDYSQFFSLENLIISLEDFIDGSDLETQISEAAWSTVSVNNQRYGVPILMETLALYFNRTRLNEAGLPKTLGEIAAFPVNFQLASDLQNPIMPQLSLYYTGGIYFGLGGRLFNEVTGVNYWNQDDSAALYLDYVKSLFMVWNIPVEGDQEPSISPFEEKQTIFFVDGSWNYSKYRNLYGNDLGVAPLPNIDREHKWRPYIRSQSLFATVKNQNLRATLDFLTFVTKPENLSLASSIGNYAPPVPNLEGVNADLNVFARQADYGIPFPYQYFSGPYWDVIGSSIYDVTIGGIDPSTAALTAEQKINDPQPQ